MCQRGQMKKRSSGSFSCYLIRLLSQAAEEEAGLWERTETRSFFSMSVGRLDRFQQQEAKTTQDKPIGGMTQETIKLLPAI